MGFKKLYLRLEKFFLYTNCFFAVLLLSSYLSTMISPQRFWPLAFLGLIYLILLFINLFFCIYWAIRLRKYFFISTISILIGFNFLLNNIGLNFFHRASSFSGVPHLKLMTYNVHNFRTIDLPLNLPANKQILKLINLNQPDILGLEEFYLQSSRLKICDSLKKVLNTDQYYFEPFVKNETDSTGLALFSKYPIINRGVVEFSNEGNDNPGIYIDIKYKSRIIRVYDFHLHSIELDPEDYYILRHRAAIGWYGLKKIILKLKEGFILRGQQADLIRQHAAKCPYPYIFMGDFNDTPASYTLNQMAKGMKNAFKEKGTGTGKTFNGGFSSFQIDYILVSKQFHVSDYQIIHKTISDHFPVCSAVELN
jgi:endonuclease/exonuclease/phosphatase family metal-dependent hydrolase